eukprot:4801654-Prymnesium_polylepis.2
MPDAFGCSDATTVRLCTGGSGCAPPCPDPRAGRAPHVRGVWANTCLQLAVGQKPVLIWICHTVSENYNYGVRPGDVT